MSAKLAVDGGSPVRAEPFPRYVVPPPADDPDPLAAFEGELTQFVGGGRIAVASASLVEAYALAFEAIGLDDGEVVVPTLHGDPATEAVKAAGMTPVPGDIDPETVSLSPRGLARALGEATRAAVVVHAFGHPATMPELLGLAERGEVAIIEDVTEALGGEHRGEPVGSFGTAAVLGFGREHVLTGGEGAAGGAVLLEDAGAERARAVRSVPEEQSLRIALAELRAITASLQRRREAAWQLTEQLRGIRALAKMAHGRWVRHGYDRYVVRLRSQLWKRTAADTVAALTAEGITCEVAIGPSLHRDAKVRATMGEDDERLLDRDFAASSPLPGELIAIPLAGIEASSDVDHVAEALRKIADADAEAAERANAG
ncbi:MAG TPA: DegT/DnrJ/EryC1/StrS family aminotransferase [Dehalococcoidia bacterium]|jgi:dTDP-4-amino-4,6-dideoxygalactose transaminase|nr:DegT/DnrJ/EryC1/StrS family aminotransferase [Dehalococcoidia bacterium]